MEILLPIFLLSGQFKSYLNFFGIELPVDLTMVLAFLVIVLLVWRLYISQKLETRQIIYVGIGLLLMFYGWLIFTLFYTSSESYSQTKTLYFALNIVAFTVPLIYQGFNFRRFLRYFTGLTLILAVSLLPFQYLNMLEVSEADPLGAFQAIEGLYLSLSGYLGLLMVLYLTAREPIWRNRLYDRQLGGVVIMLMLLLGARGPLLFGGVVFVLYYLYNLKVLRLAIGYKSVQVIIAGGLILFVSLVLMLQFEATQSLLVRTFGRFYSLVAGLMTGGAADASSMVRIALYRDALDGIFNGLQETLLGYGVGSFGIETFGEDIRLYPHNMILEIWFETGFIGLVLFTGWVIYVLIHTIQIPYRHISYWLLLYFLFNLMKSSSLVDIRTEFAFFGLFLAQFFLLKTEDRSMPPALTGGPKLV